ncbi:MAG: hypothetical protein AABY15_03030 [Nanoarchaeota archaeon]
MIKVSIDYICDDCGKTRNESLEIEGFEEVSCALANNDQGFLLDDWAYEDEELEEGKAKTKLMCPECYFKE